MEISTEEKEVLMMATVGLELSTEEEEEEEELMSWLGGVRRRRS